MLCTILYSVVVGFEQTLYTATEGVDASVEICAVVMSGTLARNGLVTFSTIDGSATSTGEPTKYKCVFCPKWL